VASRRQVVRRRLGGAGAFVLGEQRVLGRRESGEDEGEQEGDGARRERHAEDDQEHDAAEQQERPDAGVRQISEREASERGGEGAVEAERGVGRDRERGGDESKPRLGAERGPQHGER
jgi:hypothetical protein